MAIRFEELWDQIDHFVVVEACESFSGRPKPLFFLEHRTRFKPYEDKLTYRAVTQLPPNPNHSEEGRFLREATQRNAITEAISELNLSANDIVIVSDVDEIPRASALDCLDNSLANHDYTIFVLNNFRGFINNTSEAALNGASWVGPVACRVSTLIREGAQQVRRGKNKASRILVSRSDDYHYVDDGGWHFSSFGGPEAFWLKVANFSHIVDPYRVHPARDSVPEQQVFSAALNREQCRALQRQYLAYSDAAVFSPLEFDTFDIIQDVPAFLRREKERFRAFFFFTDLVRLS